MKIKFSGYIPRMFEDGTSMSCDDFEMNLKYNVKNLIIEDIHDQRENATWKVYIDNILFSDEIVIDAELLNYFEKNYVRNKKLFSYIDKITFKYVGYDGLGYDIVLAVKDEKFEELLRE